MPPAAFAKNLATVIPVRAPNACRTTAVAALIAARRFAIRILAYVNALTQVNARPARLATGTPAPAVPTR